MDAADGLEAAVLKLADKEVQVFGICGGFQMMGRTLLDELGMETSQGAEAEGKAIRGMGLLPVQTVYEQEKTRTRMTGAFGSVSGIFSELY